MGKWAIASRRAAAFVCAIALAGAAVAAAEQWVSQDGRLHITVPDGWPVDVMSGAGSPVLQIAAGNADQECQVFVVPNLGTATATTDQILRTFNRPLTPEQWSGIVSGIPLVRNGSVTTTGIDTTGFWPRQEALVNKDGGVIYASVQGRPGYDIYSFCKTYSGADDPALYNTILDSVGAGGDAAAEAAAALQPAPAPQ